MELITNKPIIIFKKSEAKVIQKFCNIIDCLDDERSINICDEEIVDIMKIVSDLSYCFESNKIVELPNSVNIKIEND